MEKFEILQNMTMEEKRENKKLIHEFLDDLRNSIKNNEFESLNMNDVGGANVIVTANIKRKNNPPAGDLVVYFEDGEDVVSLFYYIAKVLISPQAYKLFALTALKYSEEHPDINDYNPLLLYLVETMDEYVRQLEKGDVSSNLIVLNLVGEEIYGKYYEKHLSYLKRINGLS